ncbi:hypothetical protein K437DRAFT_253406 [Tilletiaria anomala UBC 951]|uniref:Chromatin modification-related protein n=1 Tax=Tilletiaria anomala (strain ATCC 24038 / CBS 436.72 / UBC 951) TaxID=1037660 RepID=A0A066WGZ0_TILAU|nr:uncharacterized protein K437DRAFT_253406 [Tilletiaria anomala UBC 951]KDN53081.1 hypothetical protein K437DRAFT_253406 [Tilletiaria anomala UBC 951]
MEDPAEIAAIAQEFISGLDNLPQEVGHMIKEIEHKESKVQDLLPRIANRQSQLRDLLSKGGTGLTNPGAILPEADRIKMDKLLEKIKGDFDRAEELSQQKATLSLQLWREVHRHSTRLKDEMTKIAPHVLESFSANDVMPPMPSLTGLPASLAGLKAHADGDPALKRKASVMMTGANSPVTFGARASSGTATPKGWRQGTPDALSGSLQGARGTSPSIKNTARKSMPKPGPPRPSSSLARGPSLERDMIDLDADGELEIEALPDPEEILETGVQEKDETPYCFCQRVSFGEMIGCDGADCRYEWFHIGCVGVSKPLPPTWYCDDCKERLNATQQKKKKK